MGITVAGDIGAYYGYLEIGARTRLPLYVRARLIIRILLPGEVDLRGRDGGSY